MNEFDAIPGFDATKAKLVKLIQSDRIPHALLFSGSEDTPKKEIVLSFARMIIGTDKKEHPDIRTYVPEGKVGLHAISAMRRLTEDVYLSPFEAQKKVFILYEAERMLPTSANALLKTFEEPAQDSVIILVTSHPSQIISTVLSRCQKISIDEEHRNAHKSCPLKQLVLDSVANGSLYSYSHILDLSNQLATQIEEESKEMESALKNDLIDQRSDMLTSAQKESLLKEVQGTVSLRKKTRVKELLLALQMWYRDLHLLKVKGNHDLLFNPEKIEELSKSVANKDPLPLDMVELAVKETLISLDRSTSPKICFENFFLRLI